MRCDTCAPPSDSTTVGGMTQRMVKNRSVPNVSTERLLDALGRLHVTCHTVDGLRASDLSRHNLVDLGRKSLLVRDELKRRGVDNGVVGCAFCSGALGVVS